MISNQQTKSTPRIILIPMMQHVLFFVRTSKCPSGTWPLTEDATSGAIMHKVHPSFQSDSSLSLQLLYRISQCFRRSHIVRHAWVLGSRKWRLVKVLRQVSPVRIRHFSHCANDASELTVLHCSSKVKSLIGNALCSGFRGITA